MTDPVINTIINNFFTAKNELALARDVYFTASGKYIDECFKLSELLISNSHCDDDELKSLRKSIETLCLQKDASNNNFLQARTKFRKCERIYNNLEKIKTLIILEEYASRYMDVVSNIANDHKLTAKKAEDYMLLSRKCFSHLASKAFSELLPLALVISDNKTQIISDYEIAVKSATLDLEHAEMDYETKKEIARMANMTVIEAHNKLLDATGAVLDACD